MVYRVKTVSEGDILPELGQLVAQFEAFLKKQKSTSEEISKYSNTFDKMFDNIGNSIETHQQV
jgi:hypothetical protein